MVQGVASHTWANPGMGVCTLLLQVNSIPGVFWILDPVLPGCVSALGRSSALSRLAPYALIPQA